jgi:hypothetical protein
VCSPGETSSNSISPVPSSQTWSAPSTLAQKSVSSSPFSSTAVTRMEPVARALTKATRVVSPVATVTVWSSAGR